MVTESSNDGDFISRAGNGTKGCSICGRRGHQQNLCPNVLELGGTALDIGKDIKSREQLTTLLPVPNSFFNHTRESDDKRSVSSTFPAHGVKGVVIYRRFYILDPSHEKMCLECTILGDNAVPMPDFTKQLFSINAAIQFILKSKSNIIVSHLQNRTANNDSNVGLDRMVHPNLNMNQPLQILLQQQQLQSAQVLLQLSHSQHSLSNYSSPSEFLNQTSNTNSNRIPTEFTMPMSSTFFNTTAYNNQSGYL